MNYASLDCEELDRMKSVATTPELKDKYFAKRKIHSDEVTEMRGRYAAAQVQSRTEASDFLLISIDGTDSNCCHCPQHWKEAVHDDAKAGTFVEQSIMSVVIHHAKDKLRYYASIPIVS